MFLLKRKVSFGRAKKSSACFIGSLSVKPVWRSSFVMIYASGFAEGGIAAGVRLGIMLEILAVSARCAYLRDATISGKASRADQHRRLH